MTVKEIIKRVREYLDEVESHDIDVMSGSVPVEERIKALIPECAIHYMEGKSMSDEVISSFAINATGMATMDVPSDWGRLTELRLSCWHRSVYDTIEVDSATYSRQQNLVTRGGTVRPVVAIVPYGEGRRLEMYSVPAWDNRVEVERAVYVPMPTITADTDEVEIRPDKEAALCYMIAIRVSRTYGNAQAVEMLNASLTEELTLMKQRIL